MKRIPIATAKRIAKDFDAAQVVIWACDANGAQHVTTYGTTLEQCKLAATGWQSCQACSWGHRGK